MPDIGHSPQSASGPIAVFDDKAALQEFELGAQKADVDLCRRKWMKSTNLLAAAIKHLAILEQTQKRVIGYFQALFRLTHQRAGSTVKITNTYLSNAVVNYGGDQQPLQTFCPA